MATLVPDAVINAELQETVSRASIRRMIQGGSNILAATSETQRNQRLAEVQAAGIEPSIDNRIYVHRTDENSIECYDGASWRYVVPPSNIMVINGQNYQRSGRRTVNVNMNGTAGSLFYGQASFSLPKAAPPGWEYSIIATGASTLMWLGSIPEISGTSATIRVASFAASQRAAIVWWQLVESR